MSMKQVDPLSEYSTSKLLSVSFPTSLGVEAVISASKSTSVIELMSNMATEFLVGR
jgi:hypothetical protein